MTSNRTNSTTPTTRQQQQGPLQCYMMANPFRAWTHYGHRPMAKPQRRLRRRGLRLARTSVGARRLRNLDMIASPTDQQSTGHVGRLLSSSGIKRHAITDKCYTMTSYISTMLYMLYMLCDTLPPEILSMLVLLKNTNIETLQTCTLRVLSVTRL